MASQSTPAKSKISLAPVKALSKPLIDTADVPRRAPAAIAPAQVEAKAKAKAKTKFAPKSTPVISAPMPVTTKSSVAKVFGSKMAAPKPPAPKTAEKPAANKPVAKSAATKPLVAKPSLSKAAKAAKSEAVKPATAKAAVAKPAQTTPAQTTPVQATPVQASPSMASFAETMAPSAPVEMLDAIRTVQQRTAELAQTLVGASQADLVQMLKSTDPAAMVQHQVAAVSRTHATFKAYWSDIMSLAKR